MKYALWTSQVLLALLFLVMGGMKLVLPGESLTEQMPFFPELFIRFIAICEVLGALGMVLPGLFHTHTELTPLAAAGLFIIMVGATVATSMTMGVSMTVLPVIAGLMAAFVAYGRWRVAPLNDSSHPDRERNSGIARTSRAAV